MIVELNNVAKPTHLGFCANLSNVLASRGERVFERSAALLVYTGWTKSGPQEWVIKIIEIFELRTFKSGLVDDVGQKVRVSLVSKDVMRRSRLWRLHALTLLRKHLTQ